MPKQYFEVVTETDEPNRMLVISKGLSLSFQEGVVDPVEGPNGLLVETVLEIGIARLEQFQGGEFPCNENRTAIHHLNRALAALKDRTYDRTARGVEGKDLP